MATLTETAYYSRKIIKFGSLGLVAFIILRGLFLTFTAYWKKIHPPPPPPPTVAFGKLPKIIFPERPNLPALSYKLETISGTLPTIPTQAKVFFIPQPSTNLLAWDRAKAWARSLGFTQEPEATDKFTYRFTTEGTSRTTLEVDVLTRNFTLNYDWQNDLEILSRGSPPQENQAISLAKSFLQSAEVLTTDLNQGTTEVTYLKYNHGNLIKALYFSEANFTRVDFFREEIDKIKVLPPSPKEANVSVILSGDSRQNRGIIQVKYLHFPISLENFATYPLKNINTAWTELTQGKGFVANLGNNPSGQITIRNAYLAYYDPDSPQNFLQPVIVFEGDNDFFAYVPAITANWQEQETPK